MSEPEENYLARGFRDVDRGAAHKMAHCLEYLDSLPSFQRYKNLILEAMNPQPGQVTADLGCGLGFDVLRLARLVGPQGRAIGVDASLTLLQLARLTSHDSTAVEFVNTDIQKLPFQDGSLHSCKVDRTLQHVERPASVLHEMFRTVRSGGVVVCAEPDWGTFTIDHENRAMVRQIAEFWEESFRNPWMGRQVNNGLREAGFLDIQVQGALLIAPSWEASDKVFDIVQTAVRLAETTRNEEPLQWLSQARERDAVRPVWSSVTLFLNVARRP
ncbi:MAG: methyltransferase domain-containing protein [Acidobacteriaceae bacterium]|nr:methyltransferase domain-containing protein [Acidobacteriaceae bacterium]